MASTRKKYETLIELAPDPIFLINLEAGTIGEVNRAAAELLGYEVDELEGMAVEDVHPSEASEAYRETFSRTIEEGEVRFDSLADGRQLYLVTRDDDRIPVELHARTLELAGRPWIVSIARDISSRRERERKLQHQNERMRKFAEIVSHDLRNPLNVATGRVDLVRQQVDSEHLETAATALDRMEHLIENTMTLAQQGESVDDPEPVDLGDLLEECWLMVETGDASLERDLDGTVEGDHDRLRRLFENLFRNAVEHGGHSVTVRVGQLDNGFFVADDGPGISQEAANSVFEPGFSTEESGTGFGLAIVESIVTAHGWEITATESAEGGARFEITGVAISP